MGRDVDRQRSSATLIGSVHHRTMDWHKADHRDTLMNKWVRG
jgi:hypothetical protein